MAFFLVLLGIIAIVAAVRASNLRRDLDAHDLEYKEKISELKSEIKVLKQSLSRLSSPALPQEPCDKAAEAMRADDQKTVSTAAPAKIDTGKPFEWQSAGARAPQPEAKPTAPPPPVFIPPPPPIPDLPRIPGFMMPHDAPPVRPHAAPAPDPAVAEATHRVNPAPAPRFTFAEPKPPRKTLREHLSATLPFEELLGMNIFAKIGIVLLVLGFAFLGQYAFAAVGPGARVALIYVAGSAMLGAGIRFESKDRYRLVARAGIGGGWAMLFFTTYAMNHVSAMTVLGSNTLDCILMLVVAAGMVAHTLQYRSQVVTGLAFLLAFSTVALSQDSIYALASGVILAIGIAAIALRMNWFELETFGIVASYANHFYWLYKLYPEGFSGRSFPEFWASAAILCCYWAIFRASYVARRIDSPRDEKVSTIAALLNTILLLAVMKFQSTHPELAFYALLGLGALEFAFGQLPVTRRRRAAFTLLTIVGSILIFAAVPFKYSSNNIALFWMIAA